MSIDAALTGKMKEKLAHCARHPAQMLNSHCEKCQKVVCTECALEDHDLHEVKKLERINFVSVFGAGILSCPRQLFVDSEDSILVANEETIEVFNSDGTHRYTIGKGVISFAYGVCMDKRARIIACDISKQSIFVFLIQQEREREKEKFGFSLVEKVLGWLVLKNTWLSLK